MKQILSSLFLTICIVATSSMAFGQKFQGNYDLLLKSGTITLTNNLENFISQPNLSSLEAKESHFYRFIQFNDLPTEAQLEEIANTGIRLLEYIPHKTYIAAIPTQMNFQLLKTLNVRAVSKVPVNAKLDNHLATQSYPDWAIEEDELKLTIRLYEPKSTKELLSSLMGIGAKVVSIYYRDHLVVIKIKKNDAAVKAVANLSFVGYLETIAPPSVPESDDARALQRSNQIDQVGGNGLKYDGTGVSVLVRDQHTDFHIDFQGRYEVVNVGFAGTHGDRVSGCLIGAGNIDPAGEGSASGAYLYTVGYVADFQDTTYGLHLNHGVTITNSSYGNGANAGYTTTAQTVDNQIWNSKTLMHVFSAGNSGPSWNTITGGHKTAKNAIATASVNGLGSISGFSSRGPSLDGRIKPDMAAHGEGHYTTDENNAYAAPSGTSFSAPSGAGVLAQLTHAYKDLNNGQNPESGLLKASVMNTAIDYGNVGPDYTFGWGGYHAKNAYELLKENRYLSGTVSQGNTNTHTFTIPANVAEARIMVYWMEPSGAVNAVPALVNDLDMTVSDGTLITQPLVLNPNTPAVAAVQGVDNANNVEQVRLTNPTAGTYTVDVKGAVIPFGAVEYYVLYEYIMNGIKVTFPSGGEGFDPSKTAIVNWDTPGNTGPFALHYSINNGISWNLIANSVSSGARSYSWNVPNTVTDEALIRVTRGTESAHSDTTFSIIGTPTNISVDTVCANGFTVSWNAVAGATSYDVMVLGDKYMDSTVTTTTTSATFTADPFTEQWISVRAKINDGVGTRATAIYYAGGLLNCLMNDELSLSLTAPQAGNTSCIGDSSVTIQVFNNGLNTQTNIPVSYQLDNNTIVTEIIAGPLTVGQNTTYTFNSLLPVSTGIQYDLSAWVDLAGDMLPQNDTVDVEFEFISAVSIPYVDNFDTYSICGTATNCEVEVCNINALGIGWANKANGTEDDIDWRIDAGGTPTNNSGPSVDHTTGTATGQYLYLEASQCYGQTAELFSPCIDLVGANSPTFSMWYHMNGAAMGELHVDVLANGGWVNDVVPPVVGNQGNSWLELSANLGPYVGSSIIIRVRGITGSSWTSDIAIDDINISDIVQVPVADFTSNDNNICPNSSVTFTDESTITPSSWQWTFTPNTVTFMNGTSANSQHPVVQFNAITTYDVKLVATNIVGSDSITKSSFITVTNGAATPIVEDFQGTFPANNWSTENPDQLNTWVQSNSITGADGNATLATMVNNHAYNANGQEDYLYMPIMDLLGQTDAALKFDLAYVRRSTSFFDRLRVELSTDCGNSYTILYDKTNINLITGGTQSLSWVPSAAGDWRKEEIDLTPYVGNSVIIRFVNVNGFGNNLYLDNINIYDPTNVIPSATYDISDPSCYNSATFTATTLGATSWLWDFGANATPQTANTAGPHTVSFTNASAQDVSLTVGNNAGSDVLTQAVSLDTTIDASFTHTTNGQIVNFGGVTTGGTSYFWDFGDGTSSTAMFPGNHVYSASGLYTVALTVVNPCGSATYSTVVNVIISDVNDFTKDWNINVFPNPNNGQFTVELDGVFGDVELSIMDITGKQIRNWNYSNVNTGWKTSINANELAKGIYILTVKSNDGIKNLKLAIE